MELLATSTTIPTRIWERIAIAILLALTCGLLVYEAWRTGITVDEPGHLLGARLYWQGKDRLKPGDMPPLIKILGGWTTRHIPLPLPAGLAEPGDTRNEWEVSLGMMERLPVARIQSLIFLTRLPLVVLPLAAIFVLWRWARRLTSPVTAIIAASLFALEPTALAHAAVFKNDLAATLAYLCYWFAIWRFWREPAWKNCLAVTAAATLCLLSKLSLLFLIALAPLLLIAASLRRRLPLRTTAAMILAFAGGLYALTLCAVQFDAHTLTPAAIAKLDATRHIPGWFGAAARVFTLLPVPSQMWNGTVALMSELGAEIPVYFFGDVYPHGHPLYFPGALAVKAPETLLALGVAGAVLLALALWKRRLEGSDWFWIVPGPLYVFLASRVPLQLGVRLILPALPFGILVCAYAVERLRESRAGQVFLAAALAVFLYESAAIYPFGIAFFNRASGGPEQGFEYLADSNLDWGQGLGELARWARAHHVKPVRLSYFGTDMMFRHFRGDEVVPISPPWTDALAKGPRLVPQPGQYYAISPTLLPGHFFPRYRDFYAAFRDSEPVARPGYSIFVYHVDDRSRR